MHTLLSVIAVLRWTGLDFGNQVTGRAIWQAGDIILGRSGYWAGQVTGQAIWQADDIILGRSGYWASHLAARRYHIR